MFRAPHVASLIALALLAGCMGGEEGSGHAPVCASTYVSVHYSNAPEERALRSAFEDAGYEWESHSDRTARATSPDGTRVVLSTVPGVSGGDLVLSVEDANRSANEIQSTASEASALVNATSHNTEMTRWTQDAHTAAC